MNLRSHLSILAFLAIISLGASSAFAGAPTISAFSPASGILNTQLTITGTNFVTPMTVSFNGINSTSVTVVSSTTAKVYVPLTASTGIITVATSAGSGASTSAFTVLPGMTGTPATAGPPSTALTLYYSGFAALEAVDFYFDTGDIALGLTSANGAGNIAVTIPASAHPGSHWITAVGRRSGYPAQTPFTVRTSWPQFGFAPNHKANNHYENVLSSATVGSLDEAWQTPAIGGYGPEAAPAVVNGIVYAGFSDGSIRAFNETTGAQQWSYLTNAISLDSSPAVANGIVYAGSTDNGLYALDAVTGAQKWRYPTGSFIQSSPTVVNGIVYFGSDDNNVYALNATTGTLVWSYATGGEVTSSPLVVNGVLYVGSYDDNVYALDAATGAFIWSFPTGSIVTASPVLAGGLICVGSYDKNMYALHAKTGGVVWTYNAGGAINGDAAASGGAIFFCVGGDTLYSLSSSGILLWSTPLPNLAGNPIIANGVVYVTSLNYTYALDQNTGTLLTTLAVGTNGGGVAVVDGAVFVGDYSDALLARFTPNGLLSNYVAPRPDPMQLRPRRLR